MSGARISEPARDAHAGALSGSGREVELVGEPPRAAQAEPESAARGIAVGEGELGVRDAGPLVLERQPEPAAATLVERLEAHRAATSVDEGIAGELARRGHDLGLVDQPEP